MRVLITVHSKIIALVFIFILLVASSFVTTYQTVKTHYWDEYSIELIDNEIPAIQRLTWLALTNENPAAINEAVLDYDTDLALMRAAVGEINTGPLLLSTGDVHLHTGALDEAWRTYQLSLRAFSNLSTEDPLRAQAEQNLLAETLNVSVQAEALNHAVEYYSSTRHDVLMRVQVTFLIITGLVTLLGYLLIRQRIVKPLSILNNATQSIAKGNLQEPLEISGDDEIGQLARSFDQMRLAIHANQAELETRIEKRTSEIATAFEFSQEIVGQSDTLRLIESAINKSRTLMRANAATLCLVTPDGDSIELASTTLGQLAGKKLIQPIKDNFPDVLVTSNQAIASQISSFGCAFLQHIPEDQCLSAPLQIGEQVIGAMCIVRSKDEPFREGETRAFSLLANSAAIAISNIRNAEAARQQAQQAAVMSERERLASELHDNLAHSLSLIGLKTEETKNLLTAEKSAEALSELNIIESTTHTAYNQLRTALENISQVEQSALDFYPALENIILEVRSVPGLQVDFVTQPKGSVIPAIIGKMALKIVSESLRNVQRHAQATRVRVEVCEDEDKLNILIQDNGKGFEPHQVERGKHLGLELMRARAERSGGKFDISSSPGTGTQIAASFPLAVADNKA